MHASARRTLIAPALAAVVALAPAAAGPALAAPSEDPAGAQPTPAASGLPPPAGTTTLVSEDLNGNFPGGPSVEASISENGRYVAYSSLAADLVANDTNQAQDVFLVDRRDGDTVRLPLPGGDAVPNGGRAFDPSIAADASVVAFTYQPPPSTAAVVTSAVLAWERATNTTTVVSLRLDGVAARNSREPSVSGDGRLIAYTSDDGRIGPGDGNEVADVYVFDRASGETELVSANVDGRAANGGGMRPSISANGRYIAFDSLATDIVPIGGATEIPEVYLRDLQSGTTELISVNLNGGYANGRSQAASVSSNGRAIAFESVATDLVEGDTEIQDVFVRDREDGTTVLASVGLARGPSDGPSGQASIAADGRIVAFISRAEDLVAAASPSTSFAATARGTSEIYARELVAGDTIRVSVAVDGGPGGDSSVLPSVGGNGRYVAFASNSPRLVEDDNNELADVFLRDLPGDPILNPPVLDFGASAVGQPSIPVGAIVSNRGWAPVRIDAASRTGQHAGDFSILADGCEDQRLRRAKACTISVGFTPGGRGSRRATLEVPGGFRGSPRTARLRGSGSRAALELDPPIGYPGIVTVVSGRGFPDGARIELRWSEGITPTLPQIVADDDGRFRVQVLVFHNDVIGPRELVASRAGGPAFPDVREEMLVMAAPNIPSSSRWQLQPPYTPPLIIRR